MGELLLYLVFFFFFSSRRRHTRSYGDWSSDVCSSDLSSCDVCLPGYDGSVEFYYEESRVARKPHRCFECSKTIEPGSRYHRIGGKCEGRSEERRVGKEWRSGWTRDHGRKEEHYASGDK